MDFTITRFRALLEALQEAGYTFQPYAEYLAAPAEKVVILRHDVDKMPFNSLLTATIENELGIRGTYYFRILPCSFNPEIIKRIHTLGHEIGYHYEDINLASGTRQPTHLLIEKAILSFESNLAIFRELTPVTTICMHGSPLSRYDNRLLWEYYDYRNFGIIGEPYFDTDFNKVLYLTDTGRTWKNGKISIRDKPSIDTQNHRQSKYYSSTKQLIAAAKTNTLPPEIMLTIHPQRWTSNFIEWVFEFIYQNLKNILKASFNTRLLTVQL